MIRMKVDTPLIMYERILRSQIKNDIKFLCFQCPYLLLLIRCGRRFQYGGKSLVKTERSLRASTRMVNASTSVACNVYTATRLIILHLVGTQQRDVIVRVPATGNEERCLFEQL